MDFYTQQDKARRKTAWLIALLTAATVAIACSVYLALALTAAPVITGRGIFQVSSEHLSLWQKIWDPHLFLWTAGSTFALIVVSALARLAYMAARGGAAVTSMFDGYFIDHDATRSEDRRLLNVTEEMAIASGIAVPRVFVIDSPSINAFAAGNNVNNAVVGVTRGALDSLNRQELQGVVAHEFSHIVNGDMLQNMRLASLIFGIILLSFIGRIVLRSASSIGSGRNSGQVKLVLLLSGASVFLIGAVGVFFGRLIKAAVSRQREFLADASAVQFTRDPEGIASALEKIAATPTGGFVDAAGSEGVSHLFFADVMNDPSSSSLRSAFSGMFSTHPPLEERIRRLSVNRPTPEAKESSLPEEPLTSGRNSGQPSSPASPTSPLGSAPVLAIGALAAIAGSSLGRPELDEAHRWLTGLDPSLQEALKTTSGSAGILLAILSDRGLAEKVAASGGDHGAVSPDLPPAPREVKVQAQILAPYIRSMSDVDVVVLADLALSTLRELPLSDLRAMGVYLRASAPLDEEGGVLGYMINALLRARILALSQPAVSPPRGSNSLARHLPEVRIVLSKLAYLGHDQSPEVAQAAYHSALEALVSEPGVTVTAPEAQMLPPGMCSLRQFDAALFSLRKIAPRLRNMATAAAARCVTHDHEVTARERGMLRAIAGVLDCPVSIQT